MIATGAGRNLLSQECWTPASTFGFSSSLHSDGGKSQIPFYQIAKLPFYFAHPWGLVVVQFEVVAASLPRHMAA